MPHFKRMLPVHTAFYPMLPHHPMVLTRPCRQPAASYYSPNPFRHLLEPFTLPNTTPNNCLKYNPDGSVDLSVALRHFSADDVKLELDQEKRVLTVTAEKEKKDENGDVVGKRSFVRTLGLPDDAKMGEITSSFAEGSLVINVPRNKEESEAITEEKKENEKMTVEEAKKKIAKVVKEVVKTQDENISTEVKVNKEKVEAKVNKEEAKINETKVTEAKVTEAKVTNINDNKVTNHIVSEQKDNFSASLDVSGFSAEDLSLEVDSAGVVTLAAKRETTSEDGAMVETRQMTRKIQLDTNAFDLTTLRSSLSQEKGEITLTAERKRKEEPNEFSVPINLVK